MFRILNLRCCLTECEQEHDTNARVQHRPQGPAPALAPQRSGPPPPAGGPSNLQQEVEKWKKEAEQHKHAAHQLAKAAKTAKQEALEMRQQLDDERDRAQKGRVEANDVIDSLQKQMQQMSNSPSKVVSSSSDVTSILSQLNDANYRHHNLMQEIKSKEDEIAEVRRRAAQAISEEKEENMLEVLKLQDALQQERQARKQHERTIEEKINHDEGSVAVLMEAVHNRDLHISDLEKQLANSKILSRNPNVESLEDELEHTRNLLEVRSSEVDKLCEEMQLIKNDIGRLLEEREQLQAGDSQCLFYLACDIRCPLLPVFHGRKKKKVRCVSTGVRCVSEGFSAKRSEWPPCLLILLDGVLTCVCMQR